MSKQPFTTSLAVAQADNTVTVTPEMPDGLSVARDFLLLCENDNIAEAVHALYYLPQNYKLMVMRDSASDSAHSAKDEAWMKSFQNRIKFGNKETQEQVSPYSIADAIISGEQDIRTAKTGNAPHVVVSGSAHSGLVARGGSDFTVQSGNPEALASAILYIARSN